MKTESDITRVMKSLFEDALGYRKSAVENVLIVALVLVSFCFVAFQPPHSGNAEKWYVITVAVLLVLLWAYSEHRRRIRQRKHIETLRTIGVPIPDSGMSHEQRERIWEEWLSVFRNARTIDSIFNGVPGAVTQLRILDGRWCFTVYSEGAEAPWKWGSKHDCSVGPLALDDVIHPSDVELLTHVLNTARDCMIPVYHECRIAQSDEDQWAELILTPRVLPDGTVLMDGILLSIRDQKLLEQELQAEKGFVEELFFNSGAVFLVRKQDKSILRINRMFEKLSGYSTEELVTDPDLEKRLLGSHYDRFMASFDSILSGEFPIQMENQWRCKDGRIIELQWIGTGLTDSAGVVTHIICVGIDITEKLRIQAQLNESLEQLTAIFENSLVGIALVRGHRVIRANKAAAEMLGYEEYEVKGLETKVLFRDSEQFNVFVRQMYPRIQLGAHHFEYPLVRKDGKSVEFRLSASPLRQEDPNAGFIYLLDDISELKMVERALRRSEIRFKSILERMASGMAIIDRSGRFVDVNEQWSRITGYSRADARNKTIFDVTHPDDCESSKEAIYRLLSGQEDILRLEKRYVRKDGSVIWADLTASFVAEDEDPTKKTLISIINDITERKQIEDKLMQANDRLNIEKNRVQILADRQRAQIYIFEALRNAQSRDEIMDVLMKSLSGVFTFRNMLIAVRRADYDDGFQCHEQLGEMTSDQLNRFFSAPVGLISEVMETHLPVLTGMISRYEEYPVGARTIRSVVVVPMLCKGILWGVVCMDDSDPFHFSDEDVAILSTINALAALQLEEITTRKNLSQEADRLRTLHELVQEMAVVRGYDAIMNLIESSELFDQLNIYRVDDGQPVHGRGGESYMTMRMHEKLMEAMNSGIARWQTQSPVPRNHLALPIQFENRIRGILHICQTELFSEKDIEICSILAEQTATFWALSDLIDQREYEALIDPLTGVWNRRYMIRRLEQEDDRLVRYGDIASVAILDMGEFKLINDVYGHVMGDEVLMQIARLLQNNIRKSDFVGRYGGDEFIIFMPNADGEAAEKQMKRLSEQISEMKLPGLGTMLEADYGIVSVPEDASSLLEGIKIADERMYYFKRSRKRSRLVDGDSTE